MYYMRRRNRALNQKFRMREINHNPMHHESWPINYENSKQKVCDRDVSCASPHEQRGSEGRSAGIEGIATRMGCTMVKYHSSFFPLQILL